MAVSPDIRRILVRAPNWIGDAVMCLPALASLKELYPASEITVLSKARTLPVFEGNPVVSGTIEYEDKRRHKGITGRLKLSREIKKMGFGLAVLFQNAFDAAFVSFISGIPERAGYARDFRAKLLTVPIKVTEDIKKRHQVFYYLNIVKELGAAIPPFESPPVPRLYLTEEERGRARAFLNESGLDPEKDFLVGASPGASFGKAKMWPPERFAETLNLFIGRFGAVALLFGGADEENACKNVSRRIEGRFLNLAGKLTLREFMAVIKELRVFITNDSGPMHIGSSLGVPTVAVFGSTDPSLTGPLGPSSRAVVKKTGCAPCFERECGYKNYECLRAITAAEVFSAAETLLGKEKGLALSE